MFAVLIIMVVSPSPFLSLGLSKETRQWAYVLGVAVFSLAN